MAFQGVMMRFLNFIHFTFFLLVSVNAFAADTQLGFSSSNSDTQMLTGEQLFTEEAFIELGARYSQILAEKQTVIGIKMPLNLDLDSKFDIATVNSTTGAVDIFLNLSFPGLLLPNIA